MKKKLCLSLIIFVAIVQVNAQKIVTVLSPDKKIKANIELTEEGTVFYTLYHQDELVLEPSRLGIVRSDADFSSKLKMKKVSSTSAVKEKYTMLHGKRKEISYSANKMTLELTAPSGKQMNVIFQLSNDGVAYRYHFPGKTTELLKINKELSSFNFKSTAKAFLQPNMDSKSGWNKTQPSYEEQYKNEIPVGTVAPNQAGWVLPALFQSGKHWLALTEAAVDTNYCGSRLAKESPEGEYSIAFPQSTEGMSDASAVNPESVLPWYTPWRVIALADNLATIVESTLGTDLALPAKYDVSKWLKPGKASWSWIILKDGSITYDIQKRYIDFAASMQWQYCLVDVNWDRRIGYERMAELAKYAATKNVKLILWYNSAGDWNTVTFYTPRNKLLTHASRVEEFQRLKNMGIAGIKVDFFPGDGQSTMKYYIDILKDAAAYEIAVNFHGSTYPRGWARTYPNLVTMESIKGEEFITFNQQDANMQPMHCTTMPFIRNLFDPMDFTPVNLSGIPGIRRRTTKGFELSLSVVLLSGIQHFAESDTGMAKQNDITRAYLQQIPDSWQDVKFIDGYPGKYIVLARRSGNYWYISGINGENKEKSIDIDHSFLKKIKEGIMISDADNKELVQTNIDLSKSASVIMKPYGGFVIKVQVE